MLKKCELKKTRGSTVTGKDTRFFHLAIHSVDGLGYARKVGNPAVSGANGD